MSADNYSELRAYLEHSEIEFRRGAPLSEFCTFKIGGPVDFAVMPANTDELIGLITFLREKSIRYGVFGKGSNLLFDDGGFRGAAIFTVNMSGISVDGEKILADCGSPINRVASAALSASLTGLEFAFGIPGSVGGAVYMNAGAYDRSMSDVITECLSYNPATGELSIRRGDENGFSYRHSVYSDSEDIILSAVFSLKKGEKAVIKAAMDENIRKRAEKQPLNYPSAGSTFKRYPGYFTARLIDEAGLKGASVGGAQVSVKHAGFIVNTGGATSDDVKGLIELVTRRIYAYKGITIEPEVRIIPR